MEFEEKLNISNSWIPVKALRNAAEIKDTYKKGFHRKTVSSPTGSPNKSAISVEVKANSPTSNTIHFNSLHSRYNTATLDIFPVPQDLPDASEKKYINNISRLNEEILIMSSQLKQANETIAMLTNKLNECSSKHALHLQSLHERHEQKIRRNRQDMDNLLKEAGAKPSNLTLEKIILEKNLEIEMQRRQFQEKINDMAQRFESQIQMKDVENKAQICCLKDQFLEIVLSLQGKFFEEIEGLQVQYKKEVDKIYTELDFISAGNVGEEREFLGEEKEFFEEEELVKKKVSDPGNESDLQIIEELSSNANMFIRRPIRESGESDLDLSLRQLINQIHLEHEASLSDIMRN